jgi:hypothetical protein
VTSIRQRFSLLVSLWTVLLPAMSLTVTAILALSLWCLSALRTAFRLDFETLSVTFVSLPPVSLTLVVLKRTALATFGRLMVPLAVPATFSSVVSTKESAPAFESRSVFALEIERAGGVVSLGTTGVGQGPCVLASVALVLGLVAEPVVVGVGFDVGIQVDARPWNDLCWRAARSVDYWPGEDVPARSRLADVVPGGRGRRYLEADVVARLDGPAVLKVWVPPVPASGGLEERNRKAAPSSLMTRMATGPLKSFTCQRTTTPSVGAVAATPVSEVGITSQGCVLQVVVALGAAEMLAPDKCRSTTRPARPYATGPQVRLLTQQPFDLNGS